MASNDSACFVVIFDNDAVGDAGRMMNCETGRSFDCRLSTARLARTDGETGGRDG